MTKTAALAGLLCLSLASPLLAQESRSFQRVSTFTVRQNSVGSAAEILSADKTGKLVVYTDPEGETLGFLDLRDPRAPKPGGSIDVGGEPTSVVVHGDYALVVVARGPRRGHLRVLNIRTKKTEANFDLEGQPDSIARSPDGRYAVIAIENENTSGTSQQPPGWVTIVDLVGPPREWKLRQVSMSGLAENWPDDPEPEYVDVNQDNLAAVTLQENNHIALVDLPTGKVVHSFSAGTADLHNVDLIKDRRIQNTGYRKAVRREPDAITWSSRGLVTADEGDLLGGTRTFTIFSKDGKPLYSSANTLDRLAAKTGHYPDFRSDDKGTEPESVEVGIFGGKELLFVGLERASLIAVFDLTTKHPRFLQLLPAGVGPEGILALPERNLLLVAAEVEKPKKGVYSAISVYHWEPGRPTYPSLMSNGLGWAGLSGLSADRKTPGRLYSVEDKTMRPSGILTIDATSKPARVISELPLTSHAGHTLNYDLEGVCTSQSGGFWVVSEGSKKKPNLLIRVNPEGKVLKEIELPPSHSKFKKRHGFEGVAEVTGKVYVAFQRPWKDDPKTQVRIARYDPHSGSWDFAHYPLSDKNTGLSGLSRWGQDALAVIERDKEAGPEARIKRVYKVPLRGFSSGSLSKSLLFDLMGPLKALNGQIPEKIEGVARDSAGNTWVVNDNDGTSDTNGETVLLKLP